MHKPPSSGQQLTFTHALVCMLSYGVYCVACIIVSDMLCTMINQCYATAEQCVIVGRKDPYMP